MNRLCHKTAIVFVAIISGLTAQAQITVGTLSEPEEGAALELKEQDGTGLENSTKGFLFPKVSLASHNSLAPLYSTSTDAQKLKAKGMVVYNVNKSAVGIEVGLNQWDGEKWTPLSKQNSLALFDCPPAGEQIRVNGDYIKGVSLSAVTNTIVLPLNVTKTGVYSIQAAVYEGRTGTTNAGFSFFGSGEFLNTGLHHVSLIGQGRPSKSTADLGGVNDSIKITVNGKALSCPSLPVPSIHVDSMLSSYFLNCGSVKVNYPTGKSIKKGTALNSSSNKLTIQLKVTTNTPGSYQIKTDAINGIQFTGNGPLVAGENTITLEGKGTPVKAGTYTYTITTGNNINMSTVCSANINVMYSDLKILIAAWDGASTSSTSGWSLVRTNAAIQKMTKAPAIFDLEQDPNAPFHAAAGSIKVQGISGGDFNNLTAADLNVYHLIIVSYNVMPTDATAKRLCDYVKGGKTVLFTVDYEGGTGTTRMNTIINTLSNTSGTHTSGDLGSTPNVFDFIPGNLAVNGQYMDLTGKRLGRDGGGNFLFNNLPSDWIVLASNSTTDPRNNAKLIMHKTYRMFLSGDGGIFSGGYNYGSNDYAPASVDVNGLPMANTRGIYANNQVWNSAFLANLLIWAFEAANQ